MRIGFIGLGIMGRPMAINLLRAGHGLTVYNRTRARAESLAAAGASAAASPREVASRSDFVITMVSDTPDVESVLFGPEGVHEGLREGAVVIDMSTISPAATVDFARRLTAQGCEMLDAPVSGGEKGAVEASLTIVVGGRREVFDRCLPIFEAMGRTIVYAGPHGDGQKTKLVNQVIGALHLVAMAEGLRLAEAFGLDLSVTHKVVSSGAAGSWMLTNLGPRILQGDFAPGFLIRLQQKDLRLVREAVEQLGVKLPGVELAAALFSAAVARGLGEQGTQGLINLYHTEI